jgi:hypothetical protein
VPFGMTRFYKVRAFNPRGESDDSNVIKTSWPILDQVQLQGTQSVQIINRPRQIFRTGHAGEMAAIEVSIALNQTPGFGDMVVLDVFDHNDQLLASVSKSAEVFALAFATLDEDRTGNGFFDLSGFALSCNVDQQFSFEPRYVSASPPRCIFDPFGFPEYYCSTNGSWCSSDADCQTSNLRLQSSSSDVYSRGRLLLNGTDSGTDLVFKTFVQ